MTYVSEKRLVNTALVEAREDFVPVAMGFWWCAGLSVAPWVGCQLGLVDGCGRGWIVVRGWCWVCLVGFSGWCSLLGWVGLVLGLVWGLGWPGFC